MGKTRNNKTHQGTCHCGKSCRLCRPSTSCHRGCSNGRQASDLNRGSRNPSVMGNWREWSAVMVGFRFAMNYRVKSQRKTMGRGEPDAGVGRDGYWVLRLSSPLFADCFDGMEAMAIPFRFVVGSVTVWRDDCS